MYHVCMPSMPERRVRRCAYVEEGRTVSFGNIELGQVHLMIVKHGNLILRINKNVITMLTYCKSGIMPVT